ncbi:DUF4124 domain-containing protein [Hydrogenophaga laconesensis]|uniref:DUF4124 domain-containing protein n=1 Tax=Hydrogenophaga laconesensis TaxID=1805971 RepID=A0ABU1VDS2_9BURK|nr:DUF4124 domain-containing protein [Hydrogenophaga laconesensis]MDR7095619.1 hypothetical protein [Hydrogenophaga laconesensis]
MPQKTALLTSWRTPVAAGFLLLACSLASAQWVWMEGGRKVFSDTAPPASVPDKSIVKRPGGGGAPMLPPAAAAPSTPAEGEATAQAPATSTGAPQLPAGDKELEARKKQAEQAEEAKRKAEEQRIAKARSDNCARARQAKATMDSGVRLATTNAKGEREVMDDKARAAESRRLDDVVRSDCGPMPKAAQ